SIRERANSVELGSALAEIGKQKQLADEQKQLAEERASSERSLSYSLLIRGSWDYKKAGQFAIMKKVLETLRPRPGETDIRGFEWHYLWRLKATEFVQWKHPGTVGAVAFLRGGTRCISGGNNINVSDATNGELLQAYRDFNLPITSIAA